MTVHLDSLHVVVYTECYTLHCSYTNTTKDLPIHTLVLNTNKLCKYLTIANYIMIICLTHYYCMIVSKWTNIKSPHRAY